VGVGVALSAGVDVGVGVTLSAGVGVGDASGVVGKACSPASGVDAGEGVGDALGFCGEGWSPALGVGTGVANAAMVSDRGCTPGVGEETGVGSTAICNFGFAASHPTDVSSRTTHPTAIKDLPIETNFLIDILVLQSGACDISPAESLCDFLNRNRIGFLQSSRRSHFAEP
jgi:hypothetical protein